MNGLARRLEKVEAVLKPPLSPVKALLVEIPEFREWVESYGLDFEAIKKFPGACDGLPHELVKDIIHRINAEIERREMLAGSNQSPLGNSPDYPT